MSEKKKKDGLNIELSEEIAEGSYSNLAIALLECDDLISNASLVSV